ncbi:MAG: glycosyltransferase family 4 protein [Desulfobacterium sp.]|nr:glycosyltransferase family 4 protein [Desulfobacterium sp.]
MKRFVVISLRSSNYDVIFIHRSLVPNGIGYLERLLQKYNHNILFDFDDAIFEFPRNKKNMPVFLRQAKHIISGSPFLKRYAIQFNTNVHEIPTCLKLSDLKNKVQQKNTDIVLGWIGSPMNLKHLKLVSKSIKKIMLKYNTVQFKIICDGQAYSIDNRINHRIEGIQWTLDKEIDLIDTIDIGIMPLYEDNYSKGKCGFKLIQYMSMGKAVICSPVGINANIVEHNINGFHASNDEEWELYLDKLISNTTKRNDMGKYGRQKVEKLFSLDVCLKKIDLILKEM